MRTCAAICAVAAKVQFPKFERNGESLVASIAGIIGTTDVAKHQQFSRKNQNALSKRRKTVATIRTPSPNVRADRNEST